MTRRGDNGPATAKLAKFGSALAELGARLRDQTQERRKPETQTKATSRQADNIAARKQLQERLLLEAEMARLAADPSMKPSWAMKRMQEHAIASVKKASKKAQKRLVRKPERASSADISATSHQVATEPSPAEKTPPPIKLDALAERRRISARLREEFATAAPNSEPRPVTVSKGTRTQVQASVEAGAKIWTERPEPDHEGYIVGLDIGTSAVKCAYGQPYRANDPVRCLTVPEELRSFAHPCLWQTVIWYNPKTQVFALTPTDGSIALEGFKSGLIHDNGQSPAGVDVGISKAEAMTAFIAMQLAYILGAYARERPLGPVGADHYLHINIGIPVAAHDDSRTRGVYAKMVSAARALAPKASNLVLSDVRKEFDETKSVESPDISLIPELVAAMSGYVADPTAPDGAHFLVDVGASTLDMVAFNLIRKQRLSVFAACVETLGAAVLEHARATNVSDSDFKNACDEAFEQVYGGARKKAPTLFRPGLRKEPVQLITTGGGCQTSVHEPFVAEMTKPAVLGDLPIVEPYPPSHITDEVCDKSRLLVAYGLTRDLPQFLTPRLPSDIGEWKPARVPQPEMITKEAT
jgi:hypothetical protein